MIADESLILWYTKSQETVETMDFTQRTCSEEDEDCNISRKGDGHRYSQGVIYIDYLLKAEFKWDRIKATLTPHLTVILLTTKSGITI